jgi:predicted ATPase
METRILHIELIQRKQRLEQVKSALKQKFLGLDEIIDEVISLMMPWYLFPDAQLRPTIINLWGLTGSGKTALVQSIVEILDHRKLYSHIDMGEFESDSASWMKNILTDDLSFFHEKPALICLDEFQFARTLDNNQNELGKDKLRVVWDLFRFR